MEIIKDWVRRHHFGTIKELSENSEVGLRTLHRWLNEDKAFVDDGGNVYKKIGNLNPTPRRVEKIEESKRKTPTAFILRKNMKRNRLCDMHWIPGIR